MRQNFSRGGYRGGGDRSQPRNNYAPPANRPVYGVPVNYAPLGTYSTSAPQQGGYFASTYAPHSTGYVLGQQLVPTQNTAYNGYVAQQSIPSYPLTSMAPQSNQPMTSPGTVHYDQYGNYYYWNGVSYVPYGNYNAPHHQTTYHSGAPTLEANQQAASLPLDGQQTAAFVQQPLLSTLEVQQPLGFAQQSASSILDGQQALGIAQQAGASTLETPNGIPQQAGASTLETPNGDVIAQDAPFSNLVAPQTAGIATQAPSLTLDPLHHQANQEATPTLEANHAAPNISQATTSTFEDNQNGKKEAESNTEKEEEVKEAPIIDLNSSDVPTAKLPTDQWLERNEWVPEEEKPLVDDASKSSLSLEATKEKEKVDVVQERPVKKLYCQISNDMLYRHRILIDGKPVVKKIFLRLKNIKMDFEHLECGRIMPTELNRMLSLCRPSNHVLVKSDFPENEMERDYLRTCFSSLQNFWEEGKSVSFSGNWCSRPLVLIVQSLPAKMKSFQCIDFTLHIGGRLENFLDGKGNYLQDLEDFEFDCRLTDNRTLLINLLNFSKRFRSKKLKRVFICFERTCDLKYFRNVFQFVEPATAIGAYITLLHDQHVDNKIDDFFVNELRFTRGPLIRHNPALNRDTSPSMTYVVYNGTVKAKNYAIAFRYDVQTP